MCCYNLTLAFSRLETLSFFPYSTRRHQQESQDRLTMATSNPILARLKKLIKRIPIARNKKSAAPKQPAATPTIPTEVAAPEQPQEVVRQHPIVHQDSSSVVAESTMPTLQIALQNQTTSNEVYAYISKHDPSNMLRPFH